MKPSSEPEPAYISIRKYKQKLVRDDKKAKSIFTCMRNTAAEKLKEREVIPFRINLETYRHSITTEEQKRIMSMPQHFPDGSTNSEWLKARMGKITGSKVADVVKHGFRKGKVFLKSMVWPELAKKPNKIFCDYGLRYEDTCEGVLINYLQQRVRDRTDPLDSFQVHHFGLVVDRENNTRAYSPDGVIQEIYADGTSAFVLAEYKCPYTKRFSTVPKGIPVLNQGFQKTRLFVCPNEGTDFEQACLYGPTRVPPRYPTAESTQQLNLPITKYYYDQVQWGMEILLRNGILRTHSRFCPTMKTYFVVWTRKYSTLCQVPRIAGYGQWLTQEADEFIAKLEPILKMRINGDLEEGEVEYTIKL